MPTCCTGLSCDQGYYSPVNVSIILKLPFDLWPLPDQYTLQRSIIQRRAADNRMGILRYGLMSHEKVLFHTAQQVDDAVALFYVVST